MISDLVRPELKGFVPYKANRVSYKVKLDANESPFGLPESIRKKICDYFMNNPGLNIYPDSDCVQLREVLSKYWDVDPEGIVVGSGSNELIKNIINVFAGKGDKIVLPTPSFEMYRINSALAGCIPLEIALKSENGFDYDVDQFIDTIKTQKAKLVILCNPNNPTGNLLGLEDIRRIVATCSQTAVVIDEAYAEFSDQTAIPLVKEYDNLSILRSFSKAYGLAGIRCGYSISSRELANEINKVKAPFNLNSLTQFIASLVFEDREEFDMQISYLIKHREYLYEELGKIENITVYPSKANFILIKVPDAQKTSIELAKKGILIRGFNKNPLLRDFLRISVGYKEQNDTVIKELRDELNML